MTIKRRKSGRLEVTKPNWLMKGSKELALGAAMAGAVFAFDSACEYACGRAKLLL